MADSLKFKNQAVCESMARDMMKHHKLRDDVDVQVARCDKLETL